MVTNIETKTLKFILYDIVATKVMSLAAPNNKTTQSFTIFQTINSIMKRTHASQVLALCTTVTMALLKKFDPQNNH